MTTSWPQAGHSAVTRFQLQVLSGSPASEVGALISSTVPSVLAHAGRFGFGMAYRASGAPLSL